MLAVMETAQWYRNDQITSIKAMFHILTQLELNNPSYFLYSNFVNKNSFNTTLEYFRDTPKVKYIYIGSHGDGWRDDQLVTPSGDAISRTEILNRINKAKIRGIFVSACNSDGIAEYVAANAPNNIWIAGYGEEVDWIKSCAFEMLFWKHVLQAEQDGLAKDKTLDQIIANLDSYQGLRRDLSFQLWQRQKDNNPTLRI